MKIIQPFLLLAAAVLASFPTISCSNSSEPIPQVFTSEDRASGGIALSGARVLVVRNALGQIILAGEDSTASIEYFVDKTISKEGSPPIKSLFAGIQIESLVVGDTLVLSLSVPPRTAGTTFSALLSLGVPAEITCRIEQPAGSVDASDLRAPLFVNANGPVSIIRHTGSCIVATPFGDLSAELALPDTGSCILTTGQGNILVSLPKTTSARVDGATGAGTITAAGLTFSSLQQTHGTLAGILGSGTAHVALTTGSGNITITGF
jgi:hypothetical protein